MLKKNLYVYILLYVFLLFIGGLRGIDVGTDTKTYYDLYKYVEHGGEAFDYVLKLVEPGWVLINFLCIHLFHSFQAVVFISVFLALTPIFIRAWKSCDNPFYVILFYVLLYFYYNSFNITRQMIAIGIIFYAFDYLEKGLWKKYVFSVIIAMLFHYSAIICVSFLWIINRKTLSLTKAFFILCISYCFGMYIIPILLPLIPYIGKYSIYFEGESSGSLTRIMLNGFFLLLFISCTLGKIKNYILIFFVGVIFYNLFSFSPAIGRISLYFSCSQLILFSRLDSVYYGNKVILRVLTIIYGTVYYCLMLKVNSCEIIPYNLYM